MLIKSKPVIIGSLLGLVVAVAAKATLTGGNTNPVTIVTSSATPAVVSTVTNGVTLNEQTVMQLKDVKDEEIIIFNTVVTSETVDAAIERLETILRNGGKRAFISYDSPGGSVFDGARLGAWQKNSPLKVYTICDGLCASMAAHLFELGQTRYMTDKSTLMFHPASGGVSGTLEQMTSRLQYVKTYVDRLDAGIAARAGIDYNKFKERVLTEYWVETQDAVASGLADNTVFLSYNRKAPKALNMEEHLKKINKVIPDNLKGRIVFQLDSITLPNAVTK